MYRRFLQVQLQAQVPGPLQCHCHTKPNGQNPGNQRDHPVQGPFQGLIF